MSIRSMTFGVAVYLCLGSALVAQQAPDPVCVAAEKVPIPKSDLPPPGEAFSPCDPLEQTSLSGNPVDPRKLRYCAFAARDAKSTEQTDAGTDNIAGNAGLAMIYAGGKGVAPNLPLAIRFACEIQDWEGDGRDVGRMLDEKRERGATRVEFDICERPTGRQMNFMCIVRDQARASRAVDQAQSQLARTGTPAQRAAFDKVLAARKAFLEAHDAEEPNGTTGAVQTAMRDEADIDQAWGQSLHDFSAGKLPRYSSADFKKADAELNAAYRSARKIEADSGDGTYNTSADELVVAERAWIAFRDAWVAFAALRWPSVSGDSWRTWLTLERTEMLRNFS